MFGIGLPEMIVILAVALIVVGPDKLPGLARSLAKGLLEMKKTLNAVKENLTQEGDPLDEVQKDLRKTADELREKMIDVDPSVWHPATGPAAKSDGEDIIDVEPEAMAIAAEIGSATVAPTEPAGNRPAGEAPQPAATPPADEHPAAPSEKPQ